MHHNFSRAALLACALCLAPPALAGQIEGSQFSVAEYWRGSAITDPERLFDYCEVSIVHRNATTLWFILRRDGVFMFGLRLNGEQFPPGGVFEVSLGSDTFTGVKVDAQVADPETVLMLVADMAGAIAAMRKSSYLTVQIDAMRSIMIPTPGADVALDAVKACFDTYSAPSGTGTGSQAPAP